MVALNEGSTLDVVDPLAFRVSDVTGLKSLDFNAIDGYRSAGDVAMSVAELMELPSTTRYSLRDDRFARMLLDDRPLGSQVQRGETPQLVVVPKAHLG